MTEDQVFNIFDQMKSGDSPFTFSMYQKLAAFTAIYPESAKITYPTLGLVGEAGEVANKVKKIIRDGNGILTEEKRYELIKEVGDIMWYLSALCTDLNVEMDEVAKGNIEKLFSRKERGVIGGSGDNR